MWSKDDLGCDVVCWLVFLGRIANVGRASKSDNRVTAKPSDAGVHTPVIGFEAQPARLRAKTMDKKTDHWRMELYRAFMVNEG